jgi:outer membrane immunogenic protein
MEGGMKKLLLLTTAAVATLAISSSGRAADMPLKAPAPAPMIAPFSWSGFYLGGNIGGAWAHRNVTEDRFGLTFNQSSDGVLIGGGQVGYNYQFGNFVIGAEGDFDWAGNNNSNRGVGIVVPGIVGPIRVDSHDTWITTIAARFGVASDHWLFYGKAGGGWVGHNNFTISNVTTGVAITGGNNNSNSGFLVGAGIEYAFTNNWTVKAEYDYLGLSSRTFIVPAGSPFLVGDTFTNRSRNLQMLKVGFNYLFK